MFQRENLKLKINYLMFYFLLSYTGVSICTKLKLPEITLVFDEAIYSKVQMIRWGNEVFKEKLVIRLGDFHCVMSFCSAIGKIYQYAGLQVLFYLFLTLLLLKIMHSPQCNSFASTNCE